MITLNKRFKTPVRKIISSFYSVVAFELKVVVVNCFACVGRYNQYQHDLERFIVMVERPGRVYVSRNVILKNVLN